MALPRSSFLRSGLRSTSFRPNVLRARPQSFRQTLRRGYATESHHNKGSDLPWAIGSLAFTIPAAGYLLATGPDTQPHVVPPPPGTKHDGSSPEKESTEQEEGDEADKEEPSKNEDGKDEDKDEKEEKKDDDQPKEESEESKDDSEKSDNKDDAPSGSDTKPGGGPVAKKEDSGVKSASGQPSETHEDDSKAEYKRKSTDATSGAQHPDLDKDDKSKKGEGIKETAKIHSTVDSNRPLRGPKGSGETEKEP